MHHYEKGKRLSEGHIQNAYFDLFLAPNIKLPPLARWAFLFTAKNLLRASKVLAVTGLLLLLIAFLPTAWYEITGFNELRTNAADVDFSQDIKVKNLAYQPPLDTTLSQQNVVAIPSIGVRSEILEASRENHETALMNGIWRVDDFGTPKDRNRPTILVAHRFGYVWWTNQFRHESSFYNLDKVKVGDVVEIVWRQRKYTYAIYAESEGEEISDYSGDLILYTCKDLTSSYKFFKYARLITV
jgi:sortase (surface protein transpeptidase)